MRSQRVVSIDKMFIIKSSSVLYDHEIKTIKPITTCIKIWVCLIEQVIINYPEITQMRLNINNLLFHVPPNTEAVSLSYPTSCPNQLSLFASPTSMECHTAQKKENNKTQIKWTIEATFHEPLLVTKQLISKVVISANYKTSSKKNYLPSMNYTPKETHLSLNTIILFPTAITLFILPVRTGCYLTKLMQQLSQAACCLLTDKASLMLVTKISIPWPALLSHGRSLTVESTQHHVTWLLSNQNTLHIVT